MPHKVTGHHLSLSTSNAERKLCSMRISGFSDSLLIFLQTFLVTQMGVGKAYTKLGELRDYTHPITKQFKISSSFNKCPVQPV